jgi:hypothetical protein
MRSGIHQGTNRWRASAPTRRVRPKLFIENSESKQLSSDPLGDDSGNAARNDISRALRLGEAEDVSCGFADLGEKFNRCS